MSDNKDSNVTDGKITRRDFLKALAWGGTGLALGGMGFFNIKNSNNSRQFAFADGGGGNGDGDRLPKLPFSESERKARGFELRIRAAEATYGDDVEWPDHPNNGEEKDYPYIASYSKGLRHNKLGEPHKESYKSLLRAVESGRFEDFEEIEIGTPGPLGLKFFNPIAGLTFTLIGPDPFSLFQPPAPRIDSKEGAADIAEVYWMALARDVPFIDFDNNRTIARAAEDLSTYSGFRGPKRNGEVTPDIIFRGNWPGTLKGPYVSQFALQGTKFPAFGLTPKDGYISYGWGNRIDQRILTLRPGSDHLTDFKQWLRVQEGFDPRSGEFCSNEYDTTPRFIRAPRDLANWVQYDDLPSQEFIQACLILLHQEVPCMRVVPDPAAILRGGSAPFHPGDPYRDSRTQEAFFNFGPFHPLGLLPFVALQALRAVWFQKWFVHRRLRPEEFGGRIHVQKTGQAEYPIHRDILESAVFDEPQFKRRNSFLLPMAYPQGAPPHPSYGAGHATASGAMATILKALFDETFVLPNAYVANKDGTKLEPYRGPDRDELTVGSEINKLASNIAVGRNFAGVHYRSDYVESILLGEQVAINFLEQQNNIFLEDHDFTFTRFNGERITIHAQ